MSSEIKKLNSDLEKLENTISENEEKYSKFLDQATDEISNFINKFDNKNISN